jgi:hypothetical protein
MSRQNGSLSTNTGRILFKVGARILHITFVVNQKKGAPAHPVTTKSIFTIYMKKLHFHFAAERRILALGVFDVLSGDLGMA